MIINSTLIFCLVRELRDALTGLRIAQVSITPDGKDLLFSLRGRQQQRDLLFSTHALNCRVEIRERDESEHTEDYQKTNLFWFALGGYVGEIEQVGFDRVIKVSCQKKTQFGSGEDFYLIFELTGRNSNAVLVKGDGRIMDCLRKVDATRSRFRQILPGQKYLPPPPPRKKNPFSIKKGEFSELLESCNKPALGCLRSHFMGVDEFLSQKILMQSGIDTTRKVFELPRNEMELLWRIFSQTFERISKFDLSFQIVIDQQGDPKAVSCMDLPFIPADQKIGCDSLNSALGRFFFIKVKWEKQKKELQRLSLIVKRSWKKLKERAKKIEDDLHHAEKFEQYKRFGDLLMMNKEAVRKGQTSVELTDVFAPEPPAIEIPLDPKLSAIGNAQRYFKRYRKAKDALKIIKRRRSETENNMSRLEDISGQLKKHGEQVDLEEIRRSLTRLGFLAGRLPVGKPKSPIRAKKTRFRTFLTENGAEILVGRNNKENDYLTFKFARPDDLWFHAQDIPGSHVLFRRKDRKTEPSPQQIREAAKVAAYFSKARNEKKAAVIYTQAKYVRKPRKGRPGLALVEREKTILVAPGLPKKCSGKL
ncbi:MAG: DUF814 domain-containing protein [candidate division Zixibacteria bacterium]|nr:DUF814 domain-containing protein [candidate division Zixibacteria bacterium]